MATAGWYGPALAGQYGTTANRRIDWVGDAGIKVALLTSSYTLDASAIDNHDFFNDVSANEVTGTGYTAGGVALGTKAVTPDTTNNYVQLTAAATTWASSTITARYAVIYSSTPGTAATNPLLGWVDFGGNQTTTAATFQITWDSTGVLRFTY
jgi:hypothetical protein